ncbi:MAG: N-acetylglucosamine kinase [Reichenbachiella sp.]|uniref:N-acetylglucosamine kinase n=1 Tax=Reichenbachiella sp. TaxID=2184521 RepID=UPI00329802A1
MILIGTSGSSKCDWELIQDNRKVLTLSSSGINPYFHTEDIIEISIRSLGDLLKYIEEIEVVFFYGSGCSSKKLQNIVQRALNQVFIKSHIYVNHDIVAAAFATYEGTSNFTCLMGTGANSCFFDGDIVRQEVPGIDYVLGDEGSGAYFGKILLQSFLRKQLPDEIAADFEETYSLDIHDILQNVYMKPFANVYLASFAQFIHKHKDHPFFRVMLKDGIRKYVEIYLECFPDHKNHAVHFVGSIPYFFEDILKEILVEKEIELGKIIKEPIEQLVQYHINKHFTTK